MTRTGQLELDMGTDAALERAGAEWMREARYAVALLCRERLRFTSDDVRAIAPEPPNANAWGALLRACAREGWIVPDGYARSERPDAHGRVVRVWKSAA